MGSTETLIPPEQMPVTRKEPESARDEATLRQGEGMTRRSFLKIAGVGAIGAAAAALGATRFIRGDSSGTLGQDRRSPGEDQAAGAGDPTTNPAPSTTSESTQTPTGFAKKTPEIPPTSESTATPENTSTLTKTPTLESSKTPTQTPTHEVAPERKHWMVQMPWGQVDLNVPTEKAKTFYDSFMANRKWLVENNHGTWQVFDVPRSEINDWYRDQHSGEGYPTRDYPKVALHSMEEMRVVSVDPTIHKEPTRSYFNFKAEVLYHDGSTAIKDGYIDIGTELAVPIPAGVALAGRAPSIGKTGERLSDPSQLKVGQIYGASVAKPEIVKLGFPVSNGSVLVVFASSTQ